MKLSLDCSHFLIYKNHQTVETCQIFVLLPSQLQEGLLDTPTFAAVLEYNKGSERCTVMTATNIDVSDIQYYRC